MAPFKRHFILIIWRDDRVQDICIDILIQGAIDPIYWANTIVEKSAYIQHHKITRKILLDWLAKGNKPREPSTVCKLGITWFGRGCRILSHLGHRKPAQCWPTRYSKKLKLKPWTKFGFNRTALPVIQRKPQSNVHVNWSPRNCYLTPLDYLLWETVKDKC